MTHATGTGYLKGGVLPHMWCAGCGIGTMMGGPVIVDVPPIPDRYYTLQVVDMYGNSTNLSSRTVGPGGGRFFVATAT